MAFKDEIDRIFAEVSVIRPTPRDIPQAMETIQDMFDCYFGGAIEEGEQNDYFLFLLDDLLRLYQMIIAVHPELVFQQYAQETPSDLEDFEDIE